MKTYCLVWNGKILCQSQDMGYVWHMPEDPNNLLWLDNGLMTATGPSLRHAALCGKGLLGLAAKELELFEFEIDLHAGMVLSNPKPSSRQEEFNGLLEELHQWVTKTDAMVDEQKA